jgi:ubiquinone/menaquinone biosynthesis C-methylase UbiE
MERRKLFIRAGSLYSRIVMTEHYPEHLLKDYELLLEYFPSHQLCRPFVVRAIEKWKEMGGHNEELSILEIGSGYGETTELILGAALAHMTLVEPDGNAAAIMLERLSKYKGQVTVVHDDAIKWIKQQKENTYDIFTASWTLHNFPKHQREGFLEEVARLLKPGGLFVIFDKVLSNNSEFIKKVWQIHLERLEGLDKVGKSDLKNSMIAHEERDAQEPFVWYEHELFGTIEKLGFRNAEIIMRNERDIVFSAVKAI